MSFNLKDFPREAVAPFGIDIRHPDEFVVNQLQLQKLPALSAIRKMRARRTNPERTAAELTSAMELRGLPLTADMLREAEASI